MGFWIPVVLAACTVVGEDRPQTADSAADVLGHCNYVNAFSQTPECKEYIGSAWTAEAAGDDCMAPLASVAPGEFVAGTGCDRTSILGECLIEQGTQTESALVFPGAAGDSCDGLGLGCGFAGGVFVPSELCEGAGGTLPSDSVFKPFERVCVDALAGEPAGASEGGQVCTWEAISASTEEGRYYADYADCDAVLTQRPYYPASAEPPASADDPRLSDPSWVDEYDWVTEQVEASACVCCHTTAESPDGQPSGWYLEAGPIWTDTLDDDGMAMMAGWIDSTAFGAFDPADNNGFARDLTGIPTTDPGRMLAYFEGELFARGLAPADFVDAAPFGGPLYDQLVFEPSACAAGEGVSSDGTVTWTGGNARYVYVLESQANPPGVPPNLDLPVGTVWRLDVDWQADAVASGISYGSEPAGAFQQWPADGQAPALTSGESYFLYVLADVYVPLTRCLFTAP